ncbi:sensor histidine kinase [Lederbergia wuyishanensis]|uniref:Signal transduction histidine-protein kinase/phosphatase DegS n=1 Tax=Lederbergia wuyishanensis TaxID=1347903 RepID=A0ABU0D8U6_9BACI|nr:sensor histidine kinase [Lederbergia wuyishanensis]MCJ8007579.1 sensor histidine kinase [Lederbergia wuyishanensis]MDQ0344838.1 two-component system sensor histidine kinase DegS [Lederbergia wuyishanensis]
MALRKLDIKALDFIVEQMIETVDKSKDEIFRIGEQCRQEHDSLIAELKEIKEQVKHVITEGDELEIKARLARKRLSEVSKNFRAYSEKEVREVYENAHDLQTRHTINNQFEKQLRLRRDDLERRLLGLQETIDRAETLVSQITIISNYLVSDIKDIGEVLEDAKMKQDFGLRIIEAQEEERKRISREIHDGPAQLLANVLIRSDLAEKVHKEFGPEQSLLEIRSLKEMIRAALYEVRRIIYDLRPMVLDDLGLIPTLKRYLATIEEYNKVVKLDFVHIGEDKRLPSKYEVALFRLIQESVQNALKHSKASNITVKFERRHDSVFVIVKDNGIGFNPDEKRNDSFGLIGMKERIVILEGVLTIDSSPVTGTAIKMQIPLLD